MKAKEFRSFILTEVKEGKTDKEIIEKLLRVEGYEDAIDEIRKIRERKWIGQQLLNLNMNCDTG